MNRNTVIPPAHAAGMDEGERTNTRPGIYESPRTAARRAAELLYQEQRRRLHAAGKRERQ